MIILCIACIVSTVVLLLGSSLLNSSSVSGHTILNVDAASDLIERSGKGLQILDVRTPEEFESGRIQSAININVRDPEFAEQISMLKQDMPILIYCRSGVRSESAASILALERFTQVYTMRGGIETWMRAGYQVEL